MDIRMLILGLIRIVSVNAYVKGGAYNHCINGQSNFCLL